MQQVCIRLVRAVKPVTADTVSVHGRMHSASSAAASPFEKNNTQSLISSRHWRLHIVERTDERRIAMRDLETNKEPRSATKMENDTGPGKRRCCLTGTMNAIPYAFSLVSFAFCFLLNVQTSEIKDRIVDLETGGGVRLLSPFYGISMDQFNSMVQRRVDELLSQVCYPSTALTKDIKVTVLLFPSTILTKMKQ